MTISNVIMLRSAGGGGGGSDGADGGGSFNMGGVIKMIGGKAQNGATISKRVIIPGLTNKSGGAGGGADGFMQLLQGAGGSGGE